jgi:hypothetical protein
LNELSAVNDIPKVLEEIKKSRLNLNPDSVRMVVKNHGVLTNRGPFNSPVHANGGKKFKFDDI